MIVKNENPPYKWERERERERERKSFLNFAGEERRKKSSFEDTR